MAFTRWAPGIGAVGWFLWCWYKGNPPGSPAFGDAFNVVAAVLASWAVLEAIKSTELQRKALEATQRALELQQRELEDTREVLDMQRQELAMQREAAEEQVAVSRVAIRLQRAAINLEYIRAVDASANFSRLHASKDQHTRNDERVIKRRLGAVSQDLDYIDENNLIEHLMESNTEDPAASG